MNCSCLKLDQGKPEAILFASPATLHKLSDLNLSIPNFINSSVAQVRNLGAIFDSTLCYDAHI